IGIEPWSDEAGFDKALVKTPITGVCGSGIIEVMAEMYLVGIISQDGVIQGSLRDKTSRMTSSALTSASVTGDLSALVTTARLR
ncbi:MAG: DUF4445 domain-containing protein, partial [Gammaproteobacteria bacterium]|nr:DUF4445 domain-containing protein [Gammaproteobacteria bacterium]